MDSFSIGISGLEAAMAGLNVVGNNMANATTEGYHQQKIDFRPAYSTRVGDIILGRGVDVGEVARVIDNLLEQQILEQRYLFGQVSQELDTLRTAEAAFGGILAEGTLGTAIDAFFNSLQDLSSYPNEQIYQTQAVDAADVLANQFQTIANSLSSLENRVVLEASNTIAEVNILINQIGELNDKIRDLELRGGEASNLRDQRDQRIAELSALISVETVAREYGVVDVKANEVPVVTGSTVTQLKVSLRSGSLLGISVLDADNYSTQLEGGKLAGLFTLKNTLLKGVSSSLDTLATAIIQKINQYHVQGVGSDGSFSKLTGWSMSSADLDDFVPAVSDGDIYFRLTNQTTDVVSRESITISASDTLSDVATNITNNITGLTASVDSSNKLSIEATGYEFDFSPAVLSAPTASTLTGTSSPTLSGTYTGTDNDTFQFKVVGSGSVGNGTLKLEVRDNGGAGSLICTLDVGSGYEADYKLHVADGIYVSLSNGTLTDTETFDVKVFSSTDASGLLASVGLNTFFSGSGAASIAVCSDIVTTPGRIATSLGPEMMDNENVARMAGLKDELLSNLSNLTPGAFYRGIVAQLGQKITVREMKHGNIEFMTQNLKNRRDEVSGVDINEQAAQMMVFERLFQAMAKYMNVAQSYYDTLYGIL